MKEKIVICMHWGTMYSPEYVNILYRAVAANIDGDFRFVCLSDKEQPTFLPEVERYPIPDIGIEHKYWYSGCWPKISLFKKDLYGLSGRALFIDLDMIICGNLNPLFDVAGAFVTVDGGKNWYPNKQGFAQSVCSCVFTFTIGECEQMFNTFKTNQQDHYKLIWEQAFIEKYQKPLGFYDKDWVVSFKRSLRWPPLVGLFLEPKTPSAVTKIVSFHGKPNPKDLLKRKSFWGVGVKKGFGQVTWIKEYWDKFS